MEPMSIYELSTTVLGLGWKAYKFFKAVQGAPAEVQEYLDTLEQARKTLADVQTYAAKHEQSAFRKVDKLQLDTVTAVLKDCELSFTLQVSKMSTYEAGSGSSGFAKLRTGVSFVFGEDAIKQSNAKLRASMALLAQAVATSVGENTILIRDQVGAVRTNVEDVKAALAAERRERELCIQMMAKYTTMLQGGISMLMDTAKIAGIQNSTRLEVMATAVAVDDALAPKLQEGDYGDSREELGESLTSPLGALSESKGSSGQDENTSTTILEEFLATGTARTVGPDLQERTTSSFSLPNGATALHQEFLEVLSSFKRGLPRQRAEYFSDVASMDDLIQSLEASKSAGMGKFRLTMSRMSQIIDDAVGASTAASILWSGIKLIADANKAVYGEMSTGLEEMTEGFTICTRELELYPGERMHQLAVQAMRHLLESAEMCSEEMRSRRNLLGSAVGPTFRRRFEEKITEMKRISDKIMREVDYRHRLEMREASMKIAEMHVQQQKIAGLLKDQQRLLETMQRERSLMDLVRQQQQILSVVQQIQQGMQTQVQEGASAEKNQGQPALEQMQI